VSGAGVPPARAAAPPVRAAAGATRRRRPPPVVELPPERELERPPLPTPRAHVAALVAALRDLAEDVEAVGRWGADLAQVLSGGGRLLACGNGGSAADAQHLTAELVGRYRDDRPPMAAIALHADTSSVTAIGNDYGYDEVYARQVRAHGRPGDVLAAISTSGTSPNVLAAARAAREVGVSVWAFTGPPPPGDRLHVGVLADRWVAVPAEATATVQEVHGVLVHILCAAVDVALLAPPKESVVDLRDDRGPTAAAAAAGERRP
jgi:D-sedoheptulose 7-phosphate isomerase